MLLPYREGSVFAVPLRSNGFAVGVVARMSKEGGVLLGYFFGPPFPSRPNPDVIKSLRPGNEIRILRFGDLSLLNKEWVVIGNIPGWDREKWPLPNFVRKDDISKRAWRVHYSEDDPNEVIAETPETFNCTLERDAMYGAGAVEKLLTQLLAKRSEI